MRDQAEREARRKQQDIAEARGIELFQQAKKVQWSLGITAEYITSHHSMQRMSHLRTEKEKELFQQFQSQQQKMADLLQSQRQQERSTEDETIAKAMEEQYAKKEVHVHIYV